MTDRMNDAEVLRILEQSDLALWTAGLAEDDILRAEHNQARAAVSALIARNAELEAQTPSALREKLRSCEQALAAAEKNGAHLRDRLRSICRLLVAEVGADGSCNAEDACTRLIAERNALTEKLAAAEAERDALRDALYNIVDVAERYMSFDEDSRFGVVIAEANKLLPRAEASHG